MDKLRAMQVFVRIVEANSFTKAAETLGLPRAALTATIKNLEAYLGTTLLQRTTRRLALTPDGADYHAQCVQILEAVEASERTFRGPAAAKPRGTLRIDLPEALGRHAVLPHLAGFADAWPELALTLSFSDRVVDLTQEGIDCALRVGELQDSSLVGRQIGSMRFATCASPAYLARHGTPQTIDALRAHQGITHFSGRTGRPFDWDFVVDGKLVKLSVNGRVAVNNADANVACALQGLGITQAALYQVRGHLERGELVALLEHTPPAPMPVSLLYPQGRMAAPKLRVFAQWVTELLAREPDLRLNNIS
ncbi:LysR family transcriptional regulator for bpeEF and oprC [Pseudoduganella flava]|uniref:LysR family transcriptional regulator n=1 Tax=Pseudoduganella flava TaxID=871742 RepID=A0A562PM57_9BURK|nr:LysR family transcriptional regulator [Pseudoduganella flava]QGZ40838.1 LysR family transcriptional regulator [Pseudoduganella flava]TWI45489.1 LysR family transcriptional regulator for bpeEF and oprC [Pseudoduganella flava]